MSEVLISGVQYFAPNRMSVHWLPGGVRTVALLSVETKPAIIVASSLMLASTCLFQRSNKTRHRFCKLSRHSGFAPPGFERLQFIW